MNVDWTNYLFNFRNCYSPRVQAANFPCTILDWEKIVFGASCGLFCSCGASCCPKPRPDCTAAGCTGSCILIDTIQYGTLCVKPWLTSISEMISVIILQPCLLCTTCDVNGTIDLTKVQIFINNLYVIVSFFTYYIQNGKPICLQQAYDQITRTLGVNINIFNSLDNIVESIGQNYIFTIGMAYIPLFFIVMIILLMLVFKNIINFFDFALVTIFIIFIILFFSIVYNIYVNNTVQEKKKIIDSTNFNLFTILNNLPSAIQQTAISFATCNVLST